MKFKSVIFILLALSLAGCATNRNLYQWGNYEETMFVYFHEPAVKQEMLENYIEFIESSQSNPKKLAPGLFAEAGTFMLDQGDRQAALRFYELEHASWPESRVLMAMLIQTLKAQQTSDTEEQTP